MNLYKESENLQNKHDLGYMYVGFGGNIYYYIAGEEYTEVFRIRRTWGDPDFYATQSLHFMEYILRAKIYQNILINRCGTPMKEKLLPRFNFQPTARSL